MNTSVNKMKELNTEIVLLNGKLKFAGTVGDNPPVSIDYIAPLGDDEGYTSLELFLLSLSSCMGSSVLTFLRRMNKTITGCSIQTRGIRRTEHPTGFETIETVFRIKSPDVTNGDMDKVLKLSEDTYCPVWSMIKGHVAVKTTYAILP